MNDVKNSDAVVFAVAHKEFKNMTYDFIDSLYADKNSRILIDVKSMFNLKELNEKKYDYWRL
jgi:UDP-N-acetyl-D-galactosamine dehydrogenase